MKVSVAVTAGILMVASAHASLVPGLFNTGVDNSGSPLSSGNRDVHYTLTGPLSNSVILERHMNSKPRFTWVAAPPGSAWIGPAETGKPDPLGNYTYTMQFDLSGSDPNTILLTGELASDNKAKIFLNGRDTGFENHDEQYRSLKSFSIDNGFIAGLNTLEFRTTNGPGLGQNPTGLLVANLNLAAKPSPQTGSGPLIHHYKFVTSEGTAATPLAEHSTPSGLSLNLSTFVASPTATPLPLDGNFGYALPSDAGLKSRIESSSDMIHWESATNVILFFRDLDSTNFSQRFYRFPERQ